VQRNETADAALSLSLFLMQVQRSGGTVAPEGYDGVLSGLIFNHARNAPEPERTMLRERLMAQMTPAGRQAEETKGMDPPDTGRG
jgi:hypothetical protein